MSEASLQTDHLVGHVLPGIAYILIGLVFLYYIKDPETAHFNSVIPLFKWCRLSNEKNKKNSYSISVIVLLGWFLIIIAIVCFILWMVDLGQHNYTTKIHRVLSMMVLPLGIAMVLPDTKQNTYSKRKIEEGSTDETQTELKKRLLEDAGRKLLNKQLESDAIVWRYFLPFYCLINAIGYYGHRHTPNGASMDMPNGEEEGHNGLFWLFLGASVFFGIAEYLAILRSQTIMFIAGSITIFAIGIWYCVLAGVLYGGAFGVNGATYYDATADLLIMLLVITTVFITYYGITVWFQIKRANLN